MRRALLFSALSLLAAMPAAAHPRVWWGPRRVIVAPPRPVYYWAPRPVVVAAPQPVYWVPEPLPRHRRPRVVVSVGGCIR